MRKLNLKNSLTILVINWNKINVTGDIRKQKGNQGSQGNRKIIEGKLFLFKNSNRRQKRKQK